MISTIKATLEVSADGTLHLPLPSQLQSGKFNVTATVEPVKSEHGEIDSTLKGFGCLKGKIHMSEDFDAPLDDFKDYGLLALSSVTAPADAPPRSV